MKHDKDYTASKLFKQAGLRMLQHPERFYPIVADYLKKSKESYVSYARNVFNGKRYMGDMLPIVVGEMFNMSITLIFPFCRPIDVCHRDRNPQVVIVINGTNTGDQYEATHATATRSKRNNFPIFGHNLKVTLPVVLNDMDLARNKAESLQVERLKKNTIARWHVAQKHMSKIEVEIQNAQKSLENVKELNAGFEAELKQLGVNMDKLRQDHRVMLNRERQKLQEEEEEKKRNEEERKKREEIERMDINFDDDIEEQDLEAASKETVVEVHQTVDDTKLDEGKRVLEKSSDESISNKSKKMKNEIAGDPMLAQGWSEIGKSTPLTDVPPTPRVIAPSKDIVEEPSLQQQQQQQQITQIQQDEQILHSNNNNNRLLYRSSPF